MQLELIIISNYGNILKVLGFGLEIMLNVQLLIIMEIFFFLIRIVIILFIILKIQISDSLILFVYFYNN